MSKRELTLAQDAKLRVRADSGQRVALVSGGTDGIGRAVALQLASNGDRVLFVGRSRERGAKVLAALRAANPAAEHVFLAADLSLLAETARVATEVTRITERLDAAVLCAGILSALPEWTSEGLERAFTLNYLSRYLLVRRLVPLLHEAGSGRVVLVANAGVYPDSLNFEDLQHRRGKPGLVVSARTQFANDLFATELAERLAASRVEVSCVFPGVTRTSCFRNARGLPWFVRWFAALLLPPFSLSPRAAARTPVFLAQDPRASGSGGRFYGPHQRPRPVPARALNAERRALLWAASEQLVQAHLTGEQATLAARGSSRPSAVPLQHGEHRRVSALERID